MSLLDRFSAHLLRKEADRVIQAAPANHDRPALGRLQDLTNQQASLRANLSQRWTDVEAAIQPIIDRLLPEYVEALIFANPQRIANVSDRKLARTRKRLPKVVEFARSKRRRGLRATPEGVVVGPLPHKAEGSADRFTFTLTTAPIQTAAEVWLTLELPEFRANPHGSNAGDAALGVWMTGGSFLASLIGFVVVDGLMNAARDDRTKPDPTEAPAIVGSLAHARDRYIELLPELATVEHELRTTARQAAIDEDKALTRELMAASEESRASAEIERARRIWDQG